LFVTGGPSDLRSLFVTGGPSDLRSLFVTGGPSDLRSLFVAGGPSDLRSLFVTGGPSGLRSLFVTGGSSEMLACFSDSHSFAGRLEESGEKACAIEIGYQLPLFPQAEARAAPVALNPRYTSENPGRMYKAVAPVRIVTLYKIRIPLSYQHAMYIGPVRCISCEGHDVARRNGM
jgi:hypothetical protein